MLPNPDISYATDLWFNDRCLGVADRLQWYIVMGMEFPENRPRGLMTPTVRGQGPRWELRIDPPMEPRLRPRG